MAKQFSTIHTFDDTTPESQITPGHTLPPEAYTDPAIYEQEVEKIFRTSWVPVCRADELAEPGSFRAMELFGEPVVIVRGKDGAVRMLSNVCRHRNAVMLEGDGKAPMIRCPYHHWVYDLEGDLRAAPYMDRVAGFDETTCTLPAYAAEEWNGFVMVNFNAGAQPFADQYPKLTEMLGDVAVGAAKPFARLDYPSAWNWKIMVENFAESYHVSAFHPKTLQPIWSTQSSFLAETEEGFVHLKHLNDPKLGSLDVFLVPPYFMFAVQRPDNIFIWYDLRPDRVDRFDLAIRLFAPETLKIRFWQKFLLKKQTDFVHREDIVACEAVQKGVASRAAVAGPLSTFERTLRKFHDFWQGKMA